MEPKEYYMVTFWIPEGELLEVTNKLSSSEEIIRHITCLQLVILAESESKAVELAIERIYNWNKEKKSFTPLSKEEQTFIEFKKPKEGYLTFDRQIKENLLKNSVVVKLADGIIWSSNRCCELKRNKITGIIT